MLPWRADLRVPAALAVWGLLALPSARAALESTMALHMLVQLPALMAAGALLARGIAPRGPCWRALQACNRGGATGLIVAAFIVVLWMLPRQLDMALVDARHELAKFLLLPLAGAALALSWPRCPPIARAVVHVEAIAMLWRYGWGYLESPVRLCANYLYDDQARTGTWLLAAGLGYALWAAWPVVFGTVARPRHSTNRLAS